MLVVHENICPACDRCDSTIGADALLAKECRESKTVNDQVILSLELQDAIADQYVRRILARTPLEEGEVRRPGLFSRLGFRLVGLAPDDRLIFSGMRPSEQAEGGVQPASPLTFLPTAPAVEGNVAEPRVAAFVEDAPDYGGGTSPSETMSVASANAMLVDTLQLPPAALPLLPTQQDVTAGTVSTPV